MSFGDKIVQDAGPKIKYINDHYEFVPFTNYVL